MLLLFAAAVVTLIPPCASAGTANHQGQHAAMTSPQANVITYTIHWDQPMALSNTTTTLQVVANPLLNPATSPVATTAFESLANLNADLVRYVPWFPYPKVGVAELEPPNSANKTTSWNFEWITPQFYGFMNATYARGHTTVPNFSTQPTWMYNTPVWDYPEDPNTSDFAYPRGQADSNTTQLVSDYYGRLLSWIVNGEFTDEFGNKHTGGPKFNLTHWEVFNEPQGCHGLDMQGYNDQYDAVVTAIRTHADPEHRIKFVGLASSNAPLDWIGHFLNESNHKPGIPRDYVSFHFYASSTNRTDPFAYEQFFSQADAYLGTVAQIADLRRTLSPSTKLSNDEMGVILPDDNSPTAPVPPPLYWNAAGSMYAYLVIEMTKLGVEVLGQSQLAGSPPIPQWDIPDPQYPSVSLLDWNTGKGNARYWVLKLLIEEFGPGDILVNTTSHSNATDKYMCGKVNGHVGYTNLTLWCDNASAVIDSIEFASFGTPSGECGSYRRGDCDASNTTAVVEAMCVGKRGCSVASYPTFGDPCYGTYKDLVVQAKCSTGSGTAAPQDDGRSDVHAQGYVHGKTGMKKVLLLNKKNGVREVTIPASAHKLVRVIDAPGSTDPPRNTTFPTDTILLQPFAVAVVLLTP